MSLQTRTITLNNEREMPLLGLGVYKATGEGEVETAICHAVDAGYRLIDTASAYKNEEGVGRGIRECSLPREELFITTKVWNNAQRIGDVDGAFKRSLERLQLDYVDLYLIHWPVPGCYIDTWGKLEKIYASGQARAIGVSNFDIVHLEDLFNHSGIVPAVNQIEYHPMWVRDDLVTYCRQRGIAVQAYAPLARGAYFDKEIVLQLAQKYQRTPAQIGLRWAVQKGVAVIPKSVHEDRIFRNAQIFDFALDEGEILALDGLNEEYRSAGIPDDLL